MHHHQIHSIIANRLFYFFLAFGRAELDYFAFVLPA